MAESWHPWDRLMKLLMQKGAQAFASLALPGVQIGEVDKQWLKERFRKVQDIIEDSWVYQETIEKGGQQALQTAAISIVVARFPELEQFAREIITTIGDQSRLQTLIVELSVASSQEHAKQLLLSSVSTA